jgi:hypothetical protein
MATVIDFDSALRAARMADNRAIALGYGRAAAAQFRRNAARRARQGEVPAVAAHRAVPPKNQRIGPTGPEAA